MRFLGYDGTIRAIALGLWGLGHSRQGGDKAVKSKGAGSFGFLDNIAQGHL